MTADENNEKVTVLNRSDVELEAKARPIVLEYKKRKKKKSASTKERKEKYTRGLQDIQRLEGDVLKVTQKATRALSKGVDTYEEERQKSAKDKKDGAIEDFFHNSAKAASTYLKEASDIPVDIADSVNKKSYRKRLRKNLRRASRMIRMWPI